MAKNNESASRLTRIAAAVRNWLNEGAEPEGAGSMVMIANETGGYVFTTPGKARRDGKRCARGKEEPSSLRLPALAKASDPIM